MNISKTTQQEQQPNMISIRRKGSLGKLFAFAALDDEVSSTNCNDDSATSCATTTSRSPSIDESDTHDEDLITAQRFVEDKELFAEFQSKLRNSQALGTSLSAGAVLKQFIEEKNADVLVRRRASSISGSSSYQEKGHQSSSGFAKAAADTTESARRFIRRASDRMSTSLLQALNDESLSDDDEEDGPLILQRGQRSESFGSDSLSSNIAASIFSKRQ